jgi:regulator of cell morphogenesis and NO signaling
VTKVIVSKPDRGYAFPWNYHYGYLEEKEPMQLDATRTVRDLATEIPNATRIFENFGIDYCCGGNKPLRDACRQANISVEQVLRSLEGENATVAEAAALDPQFKNTSPTDLIAYILARHHGYVNQEIPRLKQLFYKVVAVHGVGHPELAAVERTFSGLANELTAHMMKEEMVLFPYIEMLEHARRLGESAPVAPFGSISNPVHMMELEHASAGKALVEMRTLTSDYTPPESACFSYRTLYSALKEFEADLHQHVHLENNILFPRAIDLEWGNHGRS